MTTIVAPTGGQVSDFLEQFNPPVAGDRRLSERDEHQPRLTASGASPTYSVSVPAIVRRSLMMGISWPGLTITSLSSARAFLSQDDLGAYGELLRTVSSSRCARK